MAKSTSSRPLSAQRQTRILQATLRVLARGGIRHLRVDDIAREAGLSKGALYATFRSKDDLLLALVRWWSATELQVLATLSTERERPARERLAHWFRHVLTANNVRWTARYEFYALGSRPGPVRDALQEHWRRSVVLLAELLAQCAAEPQPATPPIARAVALTLFLEGWLFLRVTALPAVEPEGASQAWRIWQHLHPPTEDSSRAPRTLGG